MAGQFGTILRVGAVVAGMSASSVAVAQDLAVASSAPVTSIDPHYHTLAPNESAHVHLYNRLVTRDAAGKPYDQVLKEMDAAGAAFRAAAKTKFASGGEW